ncbi:MAG: epoxyqueuosine reductase QueH [bacterium]|nr:epoxyqueuosine reductase QueH [bacterium]
MVISMMHVEDVKEKKLKLLLHCCCAPCSSYSFLYLSDKFHITAYFYNPNIMLKEEHDKRLNELKRLIKEMNLDIEVIEEYDSEFLKIAKGLENEPERGKRCTLCYELRLRKCANLAKKQGFDLFSTTLSISPYKDAKRLNEIGYNLEKELGVEYLYLDLKKNDGYKKSIELSKKYNLYRQNYCGCIYSMKKGEAK